MAIGAFFFSLMTVCVKVVGGRIPNQEIVFFRGFLTLIITWLLIRRVGVPLFGNRKAPLLLRGFLGFAALTFLYYALVHLPLAEATVLQYMNPLWAAVLGAIYLGEHLGRREWLYVLGSLLGVVIIARPEFLFGGAGVGIDGLAVAAGLAGAAFSGAAYVVIRQLARTEHGLVIVFYFPLVTTPAALPGTASNFVMPLGAEWIFLIGLGLTAQAGQIYITRGLQKEEAGRATAVGYLQVVFAAIWGAIFFAEIPDAWTVAGALLILVCTVGLALSRRPVVRPP